MRELDLKYSWPDEQQMPRKDKKGGKLSEEVLSGVSWRRDGPSNYRESRETEGGGETDVHSKTQG